MMPHHRQTRVSWYVGIVSFVALNAIIAQAPSQLSQAPDTARLAANIAFLSCLGASMLLYARGDVRKGFSAFTMLMSPLAIHYLAYPTPPLWRYLSACIIPATVYYSSIWKAREHPAKPPIGGIQKGIGNALHSPLIVILFLLPIVTFYNLLGGATSATENIVLACDSQPALEPTLITIETANKTIKCELVDNKMSPECYETDWQRIGRKSIQSGGESRECLFVHPRDNTRISIIYENITLKDALKVESAISDDMVVSNMKAVYVEIYVNDTFVRKITHPNARGWRSAVTDTSAWRGTGSSLKLTVSTDRDERRHFCYNIYTTD
jgi:hypothetical protein